MAASVASAATYYFDADNGNDLNAGTTPDQAWRSLSKANSRAFQPGDQILLQRGDRFSGDWEIANVLDVHLGQVVGLGEFDASTGILVKRIKEIIKENIHQEVSVMEQL